MTHYFRNNGLQGESKFLPWESWLDEKMDRYDLRSPTRSQIIHRIVTEFIFGRAKARQFAFFVRETELRDKMATWMYILDREFAKSDTPTLFIPEPMHRNKQSDFDMFAQAFSDDYWSYVKHKLSWQEELFINDKAARYFWMNLTYYLYRFLSIEHSLKIEMADKLERELDEEERAFLISEGLLVEDKRAQRQDDEYYRDAGFYRGDRRYD
jgi:hypothetical protein